MIGNIEGHAGYVDYCYEDQISRLELLSMAKEFKLDVEQCTIWWLDVVNGNKGLKEIQTDQDTLLMVRSIGSSREVYVFVKPKSAAGSNEAEQVEAIKKEEEELDLEDALIGCRGKGKKDGDDSDLNDSD